MTGLYPMAGGGVALEKRLAEIFNEVDALIRQGKRFIVLSDRESNAQQAPIPSLLLCAAVHHHLVRTKTRSQISLLVEAGDVREVHHVALLVGYGAAAINPYLALETVEDLVHRHVLDGKGEGGPQLHQGHGQGPVEGDVQDGRLHGRVLSRGADLRSHRPLPRTCRQLLHRNGD